MTLHIIDNKNMTEKDFRRWEEVFFSPSAGDEFTDLNRRLSAMPKMLLIETHGEGNPRLFDKLMDAMNSWDTQDITEIIMGATQRATMFRIDREMIKRVCQAYSEKYTEIDVMDSNKVIDFMVDNIGNKAVIICW